MKVLILGGSGMLGHKLWQALASLFDTYVTFRQPPADYARCAIFDEGRAIGTVAAESFESVKRAFDMVQPQVVVNCIGIVKQDAAAKDPIASLTVNSLFPHRLAHLARDGGARLIHLSTDCVFSGEKGNYTEEDKSDADDLYGRTKYLGEPDSPGCLTLRTSMIGRELRGSHGLVEWFYGQRGGSVRGFQKAIFTGFTTAALSRIIAEIIREHSKLEGVYHVASEPISKFDLLTLINDRGRLNITIEPDEKFICDRSLNGSRFRAVTNFIPPSWSDMVTDLVHDPTPYDEIRRSPDC